MGTVPAPYTPTAGDDATQARVLTWADAANYLLGNATSGGSKRPLCVMRQTVAQAVANGTNVAVTLDVEDVDYDNGHSTVTNTSRYTAGTAGWYFLAGVVAYVANATGDRECRFRLNGTTFLNASDAAGAADPTAGQPTIIHATTYVFLNAGDYVELIAFQQSGGALNTQASGAGASRLAVEWRSN